MTRNATDPFGEDEKRSIAGRARTLIERIEGRDALEDSDGNDRAAEKVLEAWERTFPDEEAFERRLDSLDATRTECREAIRADRLASSEPIPDWVNSLAEMVAAIQERPPDSDEWTGQLPDTDDRPFGPLTAAIAAYTWNQVSTDAPTDHVTDAAVTSMVKWVRDRLETRFWPLLHAELEGNVAAHEPDLAAATPDEFEEPPTEHYERFVTYLFSGGFADLCYEYPVFARSLVTQVRRCVAQLRAFCTRSLSDRDRLADRFGVDERLGQVVAAEPLVDDEFDDDRALLRVEFESGLVVAYKPRSVESGTAFYRFVRRLNTHLSVPDFETPTYVVGEDYGWMEWIKYRPCADEAAVKRYYRRAGSLACVAYFLGLNDCSIENLVADGEQPLLVDVETVLQPYVEPERKPVQTAVSSSVDDTVLRTGLFPFTVDEDDNDANELTAKLAGLSVSSGTVELEGKTE